MIPDSTATIPALKTRARQLRRDAVTCLAPLATALRRRACELELEAFLLEQQAYASAAAS